MGLLLDAGAFQVGRHEMVGGCLYILSCERLFRGARKGGGGKTNN